MTELIISQEVKLYKQNGIENINHDMIKEFRLKLVLDGKFLMETVLSYGLIKEFVIGFLITHGLIKSVNDIKELVIDKHTAKIVRTDTSCKDQSLISDFETTGITEFQPVFRKDYSIDQLENSFKISPLTIMKRIRQLDSFPIHLQTGAAHCAMLLTEHDDLIARSEDIGRHNAIDKVIGAGAIVNADFSKTWICIAGRLPSDMINKAVAAGIPLIATRASATYDGLEIGRRAGITVVGRCRDDQLICYCGDKRLL